MEKSRAPVGKTTITRFGSRRSVHFPISHILCLLCGVAAFAVAPSASAATLGFSPGGQTEHAVGETFSLNVVVSSPDKALNALSGVISIPADLLELVSVSDASTVVSFWIQSPQSSASRDTVSFEGAILNPGYQGTGGQVLRLQLRAKKSGTSSVVFQSGSVLANDGQATNILRVMGSASFVIQGTPAQDAPSATPPSSSDGSASASDAPAADTAPFVPPVNPRAPSVFSITHPDPDVWYARADAQLAWELPPDVQAVRTGISQRAAGLPAREHRPAASSLQADALADGVWYAHVQFLDARGWGPVTHFPLHVDTHAPTNLQAQETPRKDLSDPNVELVLNAEDATSGIARYEFWTREEDVRSWADDGSHQFVLESVGPGRQTLRIRAVDAAGNATVTTLDIFVEPLVAPKIVEITHSLQIGDVMVVRGTTQYPRSVVVLWLESNEGLPSHFIAQSDDNGLFGFALRDRLRVGTFQATVEVVDERGAKSARTQAVQVQVHRILVTRYAPYLLGVALFGLGGYLMRRRLRHRLVRSPRAPHPEDDSDVERRVNRLAGMIHEEMRALEEQERRRRRSSKNALRGAEDALQSEHTMLQRLLKRRKDNG